VAPVNAFDCFFEREVPVDFLDFTQHGHLGKESSSSEDKTFIIPDMLTSETMTCRVQPTAKTIRDISRRSLRTPRGGRGGNVTGVSSADGVKRALQDKRYMNTGESGWLDVWLDVYVNGPSTGMTFKEWSQWVCAFVLMVPMQTVHEKRRWLLLIQGGALTAGQHKSVNGVTILLDMSDLGEVTLYRCMCDDFMRRSVCVHTIGYCVERGYIEAPLVFTGGIVARGGRPRLYSESLVYMPICCVVTTHSTVTQCA